MKLTTFCLAPLFIAGTLAATLAVRDDDQSPVPGNTGLTFCHDSQVNGPVSIENFSFNPQHPKKGDQVTVSAKGTAQQPITHGTKMKIKVKWGFLPAPWANDEIDICSHVNCPVQAFDFKKYLKAPDRAMGLNIHMEAKLKDPAGNELTCIKGKVAS